MGVSDPYECRPHSLTLHSVGALHVMSSPLLRYLRCFVIQVLRLSMNLEGRVANKFNALPYA